MQIELAGRFAKHSRSMSVSDALKTSIGEVKLLEVDYGKEPRIDVEKDAAKITGTSPFFWANQILVALPEPPIVAHVASNDPPDGVRPDPQESPDAVAVPLPEDTAEVGSSTKEKDRTEEDDPAQEKRPTKVEVVSTDEDQDEDGDDDEGAVWSIGGKK